jgi:hypothetical protein
VVAYLHLVVSDKAVSSQIEIVSSRSSSCIASRSLQLCLSQLAEKTFLGSAPDDFHQALVDGRTASRTSPARSSDFGATQKAIASGRTNPRRTKGGQRVTPPHRIGRT